MPVNVGYSLIFYSFGSILIQIDWLSRDTAGQERFRTITKSYFRNVKAIILAFDLTEKDSFEKLEYWFWSFSEVLYWMYQKWWIKLISLTLLLKQNQLNEAVVYLVGNKLDLLSDREVTYNEANKVV